MERLTEGDVPIDSFFWKNGVRFKRTGMSSIAKVDDNDVTIKAYVLIPNEEVDKIEDCVKKFTWGVILDRFYYDFDGEKMEVVKYHPWKTNGCTVLSGQADTDKVEYHCEELHASSDNVLKLVISWIAHKKLGNNENSLVYGICRALCLEGDNR